MREIRSSGSVEGVLSNRDPYSDSIVSVFLKNPETVRTCNASDPEIHVRRISEPLGLACGDSSEA